MKYNHNTKRMVTIGLLSALIVVLQLLAGLISIGNVAITLTLIPIVLGAAHYGASAGAILGGVFGLVTFLCCAFGLDKGGSILFLANPLYCFLICMGKGVAAGGCAGLVYRFSSGMKFASSKPAIPVILSAITAPVVNTGLFCLGMTLFYRDVLLEWAAGTQVVYYVLLTLVGVNFLVELGINLVLSPIILIIVRTVRKS